MVRSFIENAFLCHHISQANRGLMFRLELTSKYVSSKTKTVQLFVFLYHIS